MDFDIYDNLATDGPNLEEEIEKLQDKVQQLESHIVSLEGDIEKLCAKITEMKTVQGNLSKNISELYKTAKAEIVRKDRIIGELRSKIDQFTLQKNMGVSNKRPRDSCSSRESDATSKKSRNEHERSRWSPSQGRSRSRSRERFKDRGGHERSKFKNRNDHRSDRDKRGSYHKESGSKIKISSYDKVEKVGEDKQNKHNEESHTCVAHKPRFLEEINQYVSVEEKIQKEMLDKVQSWQYSIDSEKINQKIQTNTTILSQKCKNINTGAGFSKKILQEDDKVNELVGDKEIEINIQKDVHNKKDAQRLLNIEKMEVETQTENDSIHDLKKHDKERPKESEGKINMRRTSVKSTVQVKICVDSCSQKENIKIEEKTNVGTDIQVKNYPKKETQGKVRIRRGSVPSKRCEQEKRGSIMINENEENHSRKASQSDKTIRRASVNNTIVPAELVKKKSKENERNDENVRTDVIKDLKDGAREKKKSRKEYQSKKIVRNVKIDEVDKKIQDTNFLDERSTEDQKREEKVSVSYTMPEEKKKLNENFKINIISDIICVGKKDNENKKDNSDKKEVKITSINKELFAQVPASIEIEKAKENVNMRDDEEDTEKTLSDLECKEQELQQQKDATNVAKNGEAICKQNSPTRISDENKTRKSSEKTRTNKPKIEEVTKKLKARLGEGGNDDTNNVTFHHWETQTSEHHINKGLLDLVKVATFGMDDKINKDKRNDSKFVDEGRKNNSYYSELKLGNKHSDGDEMTEKKKEEITEIRLENKISDDVAEEKREEVTESRPWQNKNNDKMPEHKKEEGESKSSDESNARSKDDDGETMTEKRKEVKATKKDRRNSTDSKSKKTKEARSPEDDSPVESDRVLRSATRRSSNKLEKSSDSMSDQENHKISLLQRTEFVSASSVNLTDEGDIPVLHISDSDKSPPHGYMFDMHTSSTPLIDRSNVDMQLLRDDLSISLDQSSTMEGSKVSQTSSLWNYSARSNVSGKSNTSSARKRRRVVITLMD